MISWKTLTMIPFSAMFLSLGTLSAAQAATFYGESEQVGNGSVRSYVTTDDSGNVTEIGVTLSKDALSIFDNNNTVGVDYELTLPEQASSTVYKVINFDSKTYRYELVDLGGVFSKPRFNVDFYNITSEERDQICPNPIEVTDPFGGTSLTCTGDELAQAIKVPDPDAIPENFVSATAGDDFAVPRAGTRYTDPSLFAPIAFGLEPFNTVYNYGYFDGKWDFIHTDTTSEFLKTDPIYYYTDLRQPKEYPESGYFATKYFVTYDADTDEYRIAITDFQYRSIPELSPTLGLLSFAVLGGISLTKKHLNKQKITG